MQDKSSSFLLKIKRILPVNEILLLFAGLFLVNNFIGRDDRVIKADGKCYYDYLPATFIYHDLNFKHLDTLVTAYDDHKVSSDGYIFDKDGRQYCKCFAGTALMQMPFFLNAHLVSSMSHKQPADGYSEYYQDAIYHAAWFYALLGLFFLRLSFQFFGVKRFWIFWIQGGVLFASSMLSYIANDSAFGHAYSFALISIFCYLVLTYSPEKPRRIIALAAVFALIFLVRPTNPMILFFVPFLMILSGQNWSSFQHILSEKMSLVVAVLVFSLIVFIQPLIWFLQTGHWYISSYGEESFDFSNPHFVDFLFSYRKGFFVYAPWFFIVVILGVIYAMREKYYALITSYFLAFFALVYILSSWWYWSYGGSYGSRVMIDYYVPMILMLVPFLRASSKWMRGALVSVIPVFAAVAIIQTYQYKNYILTWDEMTKETYWQVFLKTDKKYIGMLWQEPWNPHLIDEEILVVEQLDQHDLVHNRFKTTVEIERDFPRLGVLIEGNCTYDLGTSNMVVVFYNDQNELIYYHGKVLFHSGQKENYQGAIGLSYFLKDFPPGTYHMEVFIEQFDDLKCTKPFQLKLFGLKG